MRGSASRWSVGGVAEIPILGVCLGHQAIGEAYGGRVVRARRVMHGKTSSVTHDGRGLFEGLPSPLDVMRYHSLIVDRASLPDVLEVLARAADDEDEMHAMRHRDHPVWGVQFHPESVLTAGGKRLLAKLPAIGGLICGPCRVAGRRMASRIHDLICGRCRMAGRRMASPLLHGGRRRDKSLRPYGLLFF